MRSEASKTLKNGFDLSEQELRRIYDSLIQQMDRVNTPEAPNLVVTFEVKFRNGVIAEPTSLDEILGFENIGSGKIERLKILFQKGLDSSTTNIHLEFVDIDSETEIGSDSISYSITGNDRDWVFITSSQLEERLSRIKKFAPNQLARKRQSLLLFQILLLIPFMLIMLFTTISLAEHRNDELIDKINQVESSWKSGKIEDPVQVTLELAKIRANTTEISQYLLDWETNKWFIFIMVGVLALSGLAIFWWYYFPFYNLAINPGVKEKKKKKSVGKFIVIGVLSSIIISVVANYISVALGIGR